jgi:hypothetical protein
VCARSFRDLLIEQRNEKTLVQVNRRLLIRSVRFCRSASLVETGSGLPSTKRQSANYDRSRTLSSSPPRHLQIGQQADR